jgi:predicted MPP superfamily phosphohydrolase
MTTDDVPILLFVAVSTAIDGAAAAWALLRPGVATIGPRRIARAAAFAAVAFVVKLPLWWELGVRPFGVIHLAYADLVVMAPALAAGLALAASPVVGASRRVRPTRAAWLLIAAALGLAPVGFVATWVEPYRLRVESAHLEPPARRVGRQPLRVGVISDIQTDRVTDHERLAVDRLMAARPDLILIPGDVFQGTEGQFAATEADLADLFRRLRAPGGVYLVLGDTDGDGAHLRPLAEAAGIRLLVDDAATVEVGDRRVTIGGVALDYRGPTARALVDRLEATPGEDDLRILLAHRPDVALGLRPGSRVDLTVAGHTHGGQIVIPGFGPPMTLSRVPRAVAAGGLHRMDGNAIYVSRGVGHERRQAPRMRLFCPPEVAVIEVGGEPPDRRP